MKNHTIFPGFGYPESAPRFCSSLEARKVIILHPRPLPQCWPLQDLSYSFKRTVQSRDSSVSISVSPPNLCLIPFRADFLIVAACTDSPFQHFLGAYHHLGEVAEWTYGQTHSCRGTSFVRLVEGDRKFIAPAGTHNNYLRHGLDCCAATYPSCLSEDDAVRVLHTGGIGSEY